MADKLRSCETETELLAAVDATLFVNWDGISEPGPELFRLAYMRVATTVLSAACDVVLGRSALHVFDDEAAKEITNLELVVGPEFGKVRFERRTRASSYEEYAGIWVELPLRQLTFVVANWVPPHWISLYMRLHDEAETFDKYIQRTNTRPPAWFNRYLYHARIAILRGFSVQEAAFCVHKFATGCTSNSAALCAHIPSSMRPTSIFA